VDELKDFLINDVDLKWTDVLETIYKVLCMCYIFTILLINLLKMHAHSCDCVCNTTNQFCYGDRASDVFNGQLSVSNVAKAGTLLYVFVVVVTANNCGVETGALFQDPKVRQLHYW